MIYIIAVFWIVCWVLTSGVAIAHFQEKYPKLAKESYRSDVVFGVTYGTLGPFALIIALCLSGFAKHGIYWRRREKKG